MGVQIGNQGENEMEIKGIGCWSGVMGDRMTIKRVGGFHLPLINNLKTRHLPGNRDNLKIRALRNGISTCLSLHQTME